MTDNDSRRASARRGLGAAAILTGFAHFVAPRYFDPINRLGFPRHTRTFTYVNGAIETMLGLLVASPSTRRLSTVVSACYITYLTTAIGLNELRRTRVSRQAKSS